jgi:hypothetical protein
VRWQIAATGLPPDWEVRFSKTRQLPYYYNDNKKESRWEPPVDTDLTALEKHLRIMFEQPKQQTTEKIRVRHLLIKHNQSRRPSSWKEVQPNPLPPHFSPMRMRSFAFTRSEERLLGDFVWGLTSVTGKHHPNPRRSPRNP